MTDADLAVVLRSAQRAELELGRNLLEQAGIPCAIREDAGLVGLWATYGLAPVAPGAVLVHRSRLAEARAEFERVWGPRERDRA